MFGLEVLDVLIGLITIYLIFGMVCTAMVEAISSGLSIRSKNLKLAMGEFLAGEISDNNEFVNAFFKHPLIQSLSKNANGIPSYISSKVVGQVVYSLVTANKPANSLLDSIGALPGTITDNRIKGLLHTLATQTQGNVDEFCEAVESHFNSTMERASGWYKRHTQLIALLVSMILVIAANVDSIALVNRLSADPEARAKLAEVAERRLDEAKDREEATKNSGQASEVTLEQAREKTEAARASFETAASDVESAKISIGWQDYPSGFFGILAKIIGLLISIFAVSLGAPFWFDMLQRFMQIRSTGKKLVDSIK